ncbi:ribonuclease H-like domain-containing protein [Tanacetum coccineum]
MVRSMWLFKRKFNADGSLNRYKARLVANGHSQQQGIDCDETFSPVVKPATIRTVLSLVISRDWPIHQLDVTNAFLHGHLSETVYMHQPPGFVDLNKPDYHSKTDSSLFVFHRGSDIAYLLLYVDDIILTTSFSAFLQRIIASLHNEFAMTDLGSLNYFLGISAQRYASGLFLLQSKFAEEILERAHMQNCNPCRNPVDTKSKLGSDCKLVSDLTLYHSLAGLLTMDFSYMSRPLLNSLLIQMLIGLVSLLLVELPSGVTNVVAETAWLRNLLLELHAPLSTTTLVYCDNASAVFLSTNPVQHQRTKHIDIDIHFVREYVASG